MSMKIPEKSIAKALWWNVTERFEEEMGALVAQVEKGSREPLGHSSRTNRSPGPGGMLRGHWFSL